MWSLEHSTDEEENIEVTYKMTDYSTGWKAGKRTSYGSMNQWQDFMSNEWDTYNFINRQAALSPVRRRPPPPSPHHGVSGSKLLQVPDIPGRPLPPPQTGQPPTRHPQATTSTITRNFPSQLAAGGRGKFSIQLPVPSATPTIKPNSLKPLPPLQLNFLNDPENKPRTPKYETLGTGRRRKPRRKLEPLFRSDDPAHLQYYKSGGYDDYHKTYLKLQQQHGLSPRFPEYGPPKLRNGNAGGSWRHVKQVLQAGGSRILFVDGQPRITDNGMVRFEEVPGANVLQPVAEKNSKTRHLGKSPSQTPWTGHQLNAFKASEGQNYMIMR